MNLKDAISREPSIKILLTISYEGLELRVVSAPKDYCSRGLDFMSMQFRVKLMSDGSYSIVFKQNKMIQALFRKYDTNKFDTIMEIIRYNNQDKVLVRFEQLQTDIRFN